MIDWLTLRIPLDVSGLGPELSKRLRESMNTVHCFDPEGVEMWRKAVVDFDSLRSDTPGICWMTHSDGVQTWLAIGASPASLEHGCNVFGSDDIVHCARVIIEHAAKALRAALPMVRAWTVRRIDITENYLLPTADAVKHALRVLLQTDGGHRRVARLMRVGRGLKRVVHRVVAIATRVARLMRVERRLKQLRRRAVSAYRTLALT